MSGEKKEGRMPQHTTAASEDNEDRDRRDSVGTSMTTASKQHQQTGSGNDEQPAPKRRRSTLRESATVAATRAAPHAENYFPRHLSSLSGAADILHRRQQRFLDAATLQQLEQQQRMIGPNNPLLQQDTAGPIGNPYASMMQQQQAQHEEDDRLSPQVAHFLQLQALQTMQQQQQQQQFQPQIADANLSIPRRMSDFQQQQLPRRMSDFQQHQQLVAYNPPIQGFGQFTDEQRFPFHASSGSVSLPSFGSFPQEAQSMRQLPAALPAAQSVANLMLPGGTPTRLPCLLAHPEDIHKLSSHQVLLRRHIEVFQAEEEDTLTHTRGRNKPITKKQVGIRCRHCAFYPVSGRQKGSTYFPSTLMGIYQAAQNMSTTHIQCGLCTAMPDEIKQQFAISISTKSAGSGAGRPYWAYSARSLGLVDTEEGIHFIRDMPPRLRALAINENSRG